MLKKKMPALSCWGNCDISNMKKNMKRLFQHPNTNTENDKFKTHTIRLSYSKTFNNYSADSNQITLFYSDGSHAKKNPKTNKHYTRTAVLIQK